MKLLAAPGYTSPSEKQGMVGNSTYPQDGALINCMTSGKLLNLSEPSFLLKRVFENLNQDNMRNTHTELGKWLLVGMCILF